MPRWKMRPQYFRGRGSYKFNFTASDQTKAEIAIPVDDNGEFDLSQEQFDQIVAIGVYANPLGEDQGVLNAWKPK